MFVCSQPRQTVLTAAGSIGQASGDLLRHIGESETDERFQVTLLPGPFVISTAFREKHCHTVNQEHIVTRGILRKCVFNITFFISEQDDFD